MTQKVTYLQYQSALDDGRFQGLVCHSCGNHTFPPKSVCRVCGGADLAEAEMIGKGVIRTFTVIRVPPEGRKPPYIVALAELEEGPWVIGQVDGLDSDAADMSLIGRPVTLGSRVIPGDVYSDESRTLTFNLD